MTNERWRPPPDDPWWGEPWKHAEWLNGDPVSIVLCACELAGSVWHFRQVHGHWGGVFKCDDDAVMTEMLRRFPYEGGKDSG